MEFRIDFSQLHLHIRNGCLRDLQSRSHLSVLWDPEILLRDDLGWKRFTPLLELVQKLASIMRLIDHPIHSDTLFLQWCQESHGLGHLWDSDLPHRCRFMGEAYL